MEEEKKSKRSFKTTIINILIIIVLVIISLFMYAKYIGTSGVNVKEYLVKSDKIPKSLSGSKIIYFSDLLLGSITDLDTLKLAIKNINELNVDIVIFGGNLISNKKYLDNKSDIVSELKNIDASLGKYFILGDNDSEEVKNLLLESDFTLLDNNYDLIFKDNTIPICLMGFNSYNKSLYNFDKISDCEEYYKIYFTHESDLLYKLNEYDFDIFLAGNTLGGEINIPFYGPFYKFDGSFKYYKDYYNINNKEVFISNGLGNKKTSLRFNNRPSINFIRLKSTEQN